MLWTCF
jgi:biotin synthase (EC 2.8.1.6)